MNQFESYYNGLVQEIFEDGFHKGDRTGTGTISIFDAHYKHDIEKHGYPILAGRKLNVKQPIVEMRGFLNAITNSKWYKEHGCPYWNKFGASKDIIKSVRKPDHLLADEYCSDNGKYKGHEQFYRDRMKELNKLGLQEGMKLITDYGINLYQEEVLVKEGELGPIYGWLWRNWRGLNGQVIDQIEYLMKTLREDPESRRIVVSAWDPAYLPDPKKSPAQNAEEGRQCLSACHYSFVVNTSPIPEHVRFQLLKDKLKSELTGMDHTSILDNFKIHCIPEHYVNLSFTMRSNDVGIGLPANIQEYTWLCIIIGRSLNMIPKYVAYTGMDVHIYNDHITPLKEYQRRYKENETSKEKVDFKLSEYCENIWDYKEDSFELLNYNPLPKLILPMSV